MLDSQRCHISAEAGIIDDEDLVTQTALLLPMPSVLHHLHCPHHQLLCQQRLPGGYAFGKAKRQHLALEQDFYPVELLSVVYKACNVQVHW